MILRSGCGMHFKQKECRHGSSLGSQSRFWRLCLHTTHVSRRFNGAAGVEDVEDDEDDDGGGGGGDISVLRAGDALVLSEEDDCGGGSLLSTFWVPSEAPPPSLDVVGAWEAVSGDLTPSPSSFVSASIKMTVSWSFAPPSALSSPPEAPTSMLAELSVQSWPLLSAIFATL